MSEKTKARRVCYWCGRRVVSVKRITLAGPARRRVYECLDGARCVAVEMARPIGFRAT